jgi:amidase
VLQTGGSSSGAGTAVSFWAANVGTETSGSILSPASANMLAAVKPTVGRVSRYGIIPITADQDTAGPMARTVTDAAILLGVLESKDTNDTATGRCTPPPNNDYTQYLKAGGLKGARIGIPRAIFYDKFKLPGRDTAGGGLNEAQLAVMNDAIAALKAAGATIVDPADIPSVVDPDPNQNIMLWGICTDMDAVKEGKCSIDFAYGMERDFNKWLASLGDRAPVKTLADLRRWNRDHQKMGAIKYGQSLLDISDAMDLELFRARYERDRARDVQLSAGHGIDEVMQAQKLDALLFPSNHGASVAARAGYPTVIVPFGLIPNAPTPAFPEKFEAKPSPFGVSFTGSACSEPTLLRLAYAFEQATKKRVPPSAFP